MRSFLLFVILLLPQLSFAFADFGHRLICNAAYELSQAETKRFIDDLIRRGDRVKVDNFAEGCTWPDDVRKTTHRETDEYHYINVPKGRSFDPKRDCGAFDCVTQAIQRYALNLNDPTVKTTSRKEALFFLGHFVADIHQPLHVGNREDKGGNTIRVFARQGDEKTTSLHWLWDKHVPAYAGLKAKKAQQNLLADIAKIDTEAWQTLSPNAWAKESFEFARTYAYVMPNGEEVKTNMLINDAYYQRAAPIISLRFQQAVVRLAMLLDRAAQGKLSVEDFNSH